MKTNTLHHTILSASILGGIMGLIAKMVDVPEITGVMPIFDDILGRLSIWILIALFIAAYSRSSWRAAVRVFCFFISMLAVYYVYTVIVLGFFPLSQIVFWTVCSIISPICAFFAWHINKKNICSDFIIAMAISIYIVELYLTGDGIPLLSMVYLVFVVITLCLLPRKIKNYLRTFIISSLVVYLLIKTGVFTTLFGDWMVLGMWS